MKPGTLNLPTIWRGCVYPPVRIAWKDSNDNPIDLTGWHPRAYSRDFEFTTKVTHQAQGLTTVSLPMQVTRKLKLGVRNWDFIWNAKQTPFTMSTPYLHGKVEVKEPVTDPQIHVVGRIGGGSNYVKMFRGDAQGQRFVSLLGRYHQDSDKLNLTEYPIHPPVLIRPVARDQMAQMVANGQTKISLFIHFFHAYLTVPIIANRVSQEYVQGIYLIPFNPSGIEGDVNVQLTPQQEENLLNLIADIKEAGFTQLVLKIGLGSFANTGCWYNNEQDCDDNPGTIIWMQDRYLHNKNYILSIFNLVEDNRGDLSVVYDLGAEHANQRLKLIAPKPADQPAHDVHRQYCRFLWAAFVDQFGSHDSTAYSVLGGQLSNEFSDVPSGFVAMLDLFKRHGLPFPGFFGADIYGENDGSDNYVHDRLVAMYDYVKEKYPGKETTPFILQETFYNDAHVALQLERALGDRSALSLQSIFQWPTLRGHTKPLPYFFPDGYPVNYFNYQTL